LSARARRAPGGPLVTIGYFFAVIFFLYFPLRSLNESASAVGLNNLNGTRLDVVVTSPSTNSVSVLKSAALPLRRLLRAEVSHP
jgi:hypothetical protein